MISPFVFALLSPFTSALINIFDKYVLSHKVKHPLSFTAMAGIASLCLGIVLALFLDWTGISWRSILPATGSAVFFALWTYLYYFTFSQADASHVQGIVFTYPLLVALLSFVFLNERISMMGYFAVILILIGVFLLSQRIKKSGAPLQLWMLGIMIGCGAGAEFLIKIATTNLPTAHSISINGIVIGLLLLPAFLHRHARREFIDEFRNMGWAFFNSFGSLLALLWIYTAMIYLPATIASSLSATQPLFVVFLERIAHVWVGKMTQDEAILPKLRAILFIVIGVVLLYMS